MLVNTELALVEAVAELLQATIIARLFSTVYGCAMRQRVVLTVHAALKYLTNAFTGFLVSVSIITKVFSYTRDMRAHEVHIPRRRSVNTEWHTIGPLDSDRILKLVTQLAWCLFRHFSSRVGSNFF